MRTLFKGTEEVLNQNCTKRCQEQYFRIFFLIVICYRFTARSTDKSYVEISISIFKRFATKNKKIIIFTMTRYWSTEAKANRPV